MLKGKDFYVAGVAMNKLGLPGSFTMITWIDPWKDPNAPEVQSPPPNEQE